MPEMDTVGVHATNFLASVTGRPGDDRTSIIDMSGRLMLHGAVSRTGGSSRENIVVEDGDGNLWVKIPFKLERAWTCEIEVSSEVVGLPDNGDD